MGVNLQQLVGEILWGGMEQGEVELGWEKRLYTPYERLKRIKPMTQLEQIHQDINALPEEAQNLLVDFIQSLKHRYSRSKVENQLHHKSIYDRFEESGLIGCCAVEEDLSISYKEVLASLLESKYDHR